MIITNQTRSFVPDITSPSPLSVWDNDAFMQSKYTIPIKNKPQMVEQDV
jgi:hypothetical protein